MAKDAGWRFLRLGRRAAQRSWVRQAARDLGDVELRDLAQIGAIRLWQRSERGHQARSDGAALVWARQGMYDFLRWRRARKRTPVEPPLSWEELDESDLVDDMALDSVELELAAQDLGGNTPEERLQRILDAEGIDVDVNEFIRMIADGRGYHRVLRQRKLGDFHIVRKGGVIYLERNGRLYVYGM